MVLKLKTILDQALDAECASAKSEMEKGLSRYKSLLLEISKAGKWDIAIWVRGVKVAKFEEYLKNLDLLEKGGLVKAKTKYSNHNIYRQYSITEKGSELVKRMNES